MICTLVLYPLAFFLPGDDHGRIEDPRNTLVMIQNSSTIQLILVWYFLFIFLYNTFGVLVTYLLNSVWHAILDNFRPITVWSTDLFIFYAVSGGAFGEMWTNWSFLELAGLAILLVGTAVYNANIQLPCFSYDGLDVSRMATPAMARSPLVASAMHHAMAQDLPEAEQKAAVTHYVPPNTQAQTQYGFISVNTS